VDLSKFVLTEDDVSGTSEEETDDEASPPYKQPSKLRPRLQGSMISKQRQSLKEKGAFPIQLPCKVFLQLADEEETEFQLVRVWSLERQTLRREEEEFQSFDEAARKTHEKLTQARAAEQKPPLALSQKAKQLLDIRQGGWSLFYVKRRLGGKFHTSKLLAIAIRHNRRPFMNTEGVDGCPPLPNLPPLQLGTKPAGAAGGPQSNGAATAAAKTAARNKFLKQLKVGDYVSCKYDSASAGGQLKSSGMQRGKYYNGKVEDTFWLDPEGSKAAKTLVSIDVKFVMCTAIARVESKLIRTPHVWRAGDKVQFFDRGRWLDCEVHEVENLPANQLPGESTRFVLQGAGKKLVRVGMDRLRQVYTSAGGKQPSAAASAAGQSKLEQHLSPKKSFETDAPESQGSGADSVAAAAAGNESALTLKAGTQVKYLKGRLWSRGTVVADKGASIDISTHQHGAKVILTVDRKNVQAFGSGASGSVKKAAPERSASRQSISSPAQEVIELED